MRTDAATDDDPDGEPEDPEFERMLREVARPDSAHGLPALVVPNALELPREALEVLSRAQRAAEPGAGAELEGRFRIERELGRGGMGVVYAATNLRTDGSVAIKRMMLDSSHRHAAGVAERFRREARAAARTRHPNVVEVYDVGGSDLAPYLVMELLHGESLRARLARGPLSLDDALMLMDGVLSGVAAAHRSNVIHRDLKPDNIFLCNEAVVRPKVLDFGVASLRDDASESLGTLTRSGAIIGTPSYMAPEQLTGKPFDARTDVYALGVMLYEMLTGSLPFVARSASELAVLQVTQEPRPLSAHRTLPSALERVVKKALARERTDRFENAEAFRLALQQLSQPSRSVFVRAPVWSGVALLLLGGLVAWSLRPGVQPQAQAEATTKGSPAKALASAHERASAGAVASQALDDAPAARAPDAGPGDAHGPEPAAVDPAPSAREPPRMNARRVAKRRPLPSSQPVAPDAPSTAPRKPTSLRLDDF